MGYHATFAVSSAVMFLFVVVDCCSVVYLYSDEPISGPAHAKTLICQVNFYTKTPLVDSYS